MLFLKVFKVGDNFDSRLRQFHIVAPFYEKHFWPFADFRMGISRSDLVLRNSLLLLLIKFGFRKSMWNHIIARTELKTTKHAAKA